MGNFCPSEKPEIRNDKSYMGRGNSKPDAPVTQEIPPRVQKLDTYFTKLPQTDIITIDYLQNNVFKNQPRLAKKIFSWLKKFSPEPKLKTFRIVAEILTLEYTNISKTIRISKLILLKVN